MNMTWTTFRLSVVNDPVLRLNSLLLGWLAGCLLWGSPGLAQDAQPDAARNYFRVIQQAQQHLDAGRVPEARKLLDGTEESQRSFEFDYLQERVRQSAEGKAPELIRSLERPTVEVRYGLLNPVQRQVVYICRSGELKIYELTAPEKPPLSPGYPEGGAVWSGKFSRDGKVFFAGHESGEVVVWDVAEWKVRHKISLGAKWPVRELTAAPDGSAFVGETKGGLDLWSLTGEQPQKIATVGERYNFGEGLAFSPQGDLLATGGMFHIEIYDAKSGTKQKEMEHASYTMGLEFSPDGKRIASAPRGNVNKFLAVFDVAQSKALFHAGPFGNYIAGMAFTPDGKRIAATGCEKQLRLFDAATGEIVLTLKRPECGAVPAFSADGRLLGWSEGAGYQYIDLGKPPSGQPVP